MDECDALHSKNCELRDACDELKRDIRELEHENKIFKDEKIELHMNNLVLHEDLERVKETFRLREESFVTDLAKLEKSLLNWNKRLNLYLLKIKAYMKS